MIKRIAMILIIILLLTPVRCKAYNEAETNKTIDDYTYKVESALDDAIDDDTEEALGEYGITADDPLSAGSVNIGDVLSGLISGFKSSLTEPLKLFGKLIAVCAFTSLVKSTAQKSSIGDIYDTAGVLVTVLVIADCLSAAIEGVKSSLNDISLFMSSYIPIFSSVLASNASISSAAGYYSVMIILSEIIVFISKSVLLPLSGAVMALCIVGAINGSSNISGLSMSVRNFTKWVLTALMTVFTAVISIKGITGAAADSVASRTIRFAASSFIPIVGGSVSEAYSTIYGSLGVIRSGVGVIGIAAVAVIALKPILYVTALKLIIVLSSAVNDLFGQSGSSALLKGINDVLSVSLGIITAMSMIFIISTAMILMTSMNIV